jgi:ribosomal peptide maturation radical SAM protein 1
VEECLVDILFAVLPFGNVRLPALGVSVLKATVSRRGFQSRIEYLNLHLAALIGLPLYNRLANEAAALHLIGEWFFADAVFGDEIPDEATYISKMLSRSLPPGADLIREILDARQKRPAFLDYCVRRITAFSPKVVGFPTTFQQTCGSLAVARRLKELPNPPAIVFGGANCEGEMGREFVDSFPWVDYVCPGEADETLPELLESLLTDKRSGTPAGVLHRGEPGVAVSRPVRDMDSVAVPDLDDYFEQIDAAGFRAEVPIGLAVEAARGCWWGAKHHCVFCGLHPDRAPFRGKSPRRVYDEIVELSRKHDVRRIETADNIMSLDFIDTLLPMLEGSGLELVFEVKSNLQYEHLVKMRAAGVTSVQPGIESLSDDVLRLMNKGCTAAQNIQFLRWCEELGIVAAWNVLAGFPGESPLEYDRMAQLAPLLVHLPPPVTCTPIRLDHFSPLYEDHERLGFRRVRPAAAYFYVFPLGRRELMRLAYYFDYDYADGRKPMNYIGTLQREIQRWWEQRSGEPDRRARLDAAFEDGGVEIADTREIAVAPKHRLEGLAARIYLVCDRGRTVPGLARSLGAGEAAIRDQLAKLLEWKLTLEISGRFLSLAVFRKRPGSSWGEDVHVDHAVPKTASAEQLLRVV